MADEVQRAGKEWTVSGRKLVLWLFGSTSACALLLVLFAVIFGPSLKAIAQDADKKTAVYAVEGMHCAGCAAGIEEALKGTEGVLSVEVSFEAKQATVTYWPVEVGPNKLQKVIADQGFTVERKE